MPELFESLRRWTVDRALALSRRRAGTRSRRRSRLRRRPRRRSRLRRRSRRCALRPRRRRFEEGLPGLLAQEAGRDASCRFGRSGA